MSSGQHQAAVLTVVGQPLKVESVSTPSPGPDEVLVEVHSIALNPIDYYMRDMGFMLKDFPAVIGSDIAGTVVSVGSSVPASTAKEGGRVTAFAPTFFVQGTPKYGAFQKFVIVPASNVCAIPDSLSFNEAAILPMSVGTTGSGWYSIGLPLDTVVKASDKKGLLVWGGSSSVGSGAVQWANLMGYTVYGVAGAKNHDYVQSLGASKMFDYKQPDVVSAIVEAAQEDGIALTTAFISASGALRSTLDILKEFKGAGAGPVKVATAIPLQQESAEEDGVEVAFIAAPTEEGPRQELFAQMFTWLKEKLETGEYKPSPGVEVFPGGFEGINGALDKLKSGAMSGSKLVLEV